MKSKLVFRAMVLGAIACAFSATGFAADVQNGHGQGIADSTTEVNGAKHEAVRSSWLDRTDIAIGVQTGGTSDSHKGMFPSDYNNNFYNTKTDYGNITKAYIETLQPITHYDENSKSVVFVQGRIGRGGEKISSKEVRGYFTPDLVMSPFGFDVFTEINTDEKTSESLGTVGSLGVGYRILSKHEHAYVGVNVFADRAFSENVNRVSGGLEYVAGLNEVRVNVYRGLGNIKSQSYMVRVPESHLPIPLNGGTANYTVYKSQKVLSGYDVSYTRSFKNARWARVHIGAYHWNGLGISSYSGGTSPISDLGNSSGWQVGTTLQVTPHVSLDLGYTSDSKYASGAYGFVKYTLGTSKFAWHGGKHSDDTITNARARMLDKVKRSPMMIGKSYEEFWAVVPYDALP